MMLHGSHAFDSFYSSNGTPQQNGTAERMNRTLFEKARCLLINAGMKPSMWGEAGTTAAYLINRSPFMVGFKTPQEMWTKKRPCLSHLKPCLSHLKPFGCTAYAQISQSKLQPRVQKCVMLGYPEGIKGYKLLLYQPHGYKIQVKSESVRFFLPHEVETKDEDEYDSASPKSASREEDNQVNDNGNPTEETAVDHHEPEEVIPPTNVGDESSTEDEGMKLLPAGRKSIFYIFVYGSVIGAGSFIVHYFSMMVNSVLVNFGLTEEMHNPVSIFLLVGITLAGAALGFYIVRRFLISDDGCVDIGVAQFVKWAMRIVASTFILQGTPDTLLSLLTLVFCSAVCSSVTRMIRKCQASRSWSPHSRRFRAVTPLRNRAEFLSKPGKMMQPQGKLWTSPTKSKSWFGSPVKGLVVSPPRSGVPRTSAPEYYSTFHNVSNRKRMSRKEWEDFTKESTREAMPGLATSPEFTDWVINNAERIQLLPEDSSDEDQIVESESDESSEETTEQSGNRRGALKWY